MKVRDLIEALQGMNQDATVHFEYNYGDYWKTHVAPEVEEVNDGLVKYSDYHQMPMIVEEDSTEFDEETGEIIDQGYENVVVLSS